MKKFFVLVLTIGMAFATTVSASAGEKEINKEKVVANQMNIIKFISPEEKLAKSMELGMIYDVELGFRAKLLYDPGRGGHGTYDSGWKNFLGGKWRHGVGTKYVWSKFDHGYKVHRTAVQGAGGQISKSGDIDPGIRAEADWERARSGNRAWADTE